MHLPDITVKLRDVIIVTVFIAGLLVSATWGYFRLYAKVEAAEKAIGAITKIECRLTQLNIYMIHGIKPLPHETCE